MKTIIKTNCLLLLIAISFYSFTSKEIIQSKPYIGTENTTICRGDYRGRPFYIYNKSSSSYQVTYRTDRSYGGKTYKTEKTITVKANSKHYLGCSKFNSNSGVSTYNYILLKSKKN